MHLYPKLPICRMGVIMITIILTFKKLGIIYCDISDNRSVLENNELNTKKLNGYMIGYNSYQEIRYGES